MHYFAKLAVGGFYKIQTKTFLKGEEQAVTKDEYDYLQTVVDPQNITDGDKYAILNVKRFTFRTEDSTIQEKVEEEILDAPDSLRPKRKKEAE